MPARTHLTYAQKKEIKAHNQQNPTLTQDDMCRWAKSEYGHRVGRSTMSKILSKPLQPGLAPEAKRQQKGRFPAMEEDLYAFVLNTQGKAAISDFMLYTNAKELLKGSGQDATISLSWVTRFKTRHGITLHRLHGEAGSVDTTSLHEHRMELQELLDKHSSKDVFNMDETGIFYRLEPSQTLATAPIPDKTKDKTRISVGLCCNMDGSEKLDPIVINKYKKPRCFKGVDINKLPIRYFANKKAWMTSAVFTDWLKTFNLSMYGRKILLLVDNASSHVSIDLSNVQVHFLPPNTTSFLQPMDAGIIKNFELKYKTQFVQWTLDMLEAGTYKQKMDILTSIHIIVEAWKGVSSDTIRNCWAHTGIMSRVTVALLKQQNQPRKFFYTSLNELMVKLSLPDLMDVEDYLTCDNADSEENDVEEEAACSQVKTKMNLKTLHCRTERPGMLLNN